MRILFTFFLLLFASLPLSAQDVGRAAQSFAQRKWSRDAGKMVRRLALPRSSLYQDAAGHFVLLTHADADCSEAPRVVGYGTSRTDTLPPVLQNMARRASLIADGGGIRRTTPVVSPLLTTKHGLGEPYNAHCPYYRYNEEKISSQRCVVGCVAVALAQLMTFHRRDIVLLDTLHGWESSHYTIDDVLPGERVAVNDIADSYTDGSPYSNEQLDAVAKLDYWCGMAAHMNWGVNESGANIRRLVEPMKRVFGYQYVHCLDSYKYAADDWFDLLVREICAGRPVLYTGYVMWMSGHAFVLDGLDGQGFFHVNWGYDGNYNGYFLLDVLNFAEAIDETTEAGVAGGFFCNQEALLLCPDFVDAQLPDTLVREGTDVEVSDICFEREPRVGVYTPMTMRVRNTTERVLTTPFEFFTNAPTDTAIFHQADYLALTGITLKPNEERTLRIHLMFNEAGERIFRLSPDDVSVLGEQTLQVARAKASALSVDDARIVSLTESAVTIAVDFSNAEGAGRTGHLVTYEMLEPDVREADGPRHFFYAYLESGEQQTDTVSFGHLVAGRTYRFVVREPWPVRREIVFTVPTADGIGDVRASEGCLGAPTYDLTGRRLKSSAMRRGQLYVQGGKLRISD